MFGTPDYFWDFMSALNCLRHKMAGAKCFWIFVWCFCDGKCYRTGADLATYIFFYKRADLLAAEPMGGEELTAEGEAREFIVRMAMPTLYEALGGEYNP